MFKKMLVSIVLILTLSSCSAVRDAIDHSVDQGKTLVTHVTDEIRDLKTETLEEVRETIEEITPNIVEEILNADGVAFLIVSVAFLLGLVVVTALILLLGTARAWWRRIQSKPNSTTQL
jgi:CHASE3 domain sensor protein